MSEESSATNWTDRIAYPIGAKLGIIITILLLAALGAITALVSVMVGEDVRLTAEDNNFAINRRSAAEAENLLEVMRSNTFVLLDTLDAVGGESPAARLAAGFFFERNQNVAFIGVAEKTSGGFALARSLVNERFFFSNELDPRAAEAVLTASGAAAERCLSGGAVLLNAAPQFGVPVLALFCPWTLRDDPGTGARAAAFVIFSSNSLTETFGGGTNLSCMVNDVGDYLVHADFDIIRAGAEAVSSPFVAMMLESADQGRQTLYTDTDGIRYFGAFHKIAIGGAAVITTIPYDLVFEGVAATTRRNIYLTGAVLFAAILFVWLFSRTVSIPLKALASAARQVEGGDFDLDLKPKTKDEVGFLTESFQRMSGALNVFGRFTNKDIAVLAMRGAIKPGGHSRNATIFFSDIRGFTEKSENFTRVFGAEASNLIVKWLNEYLSRMVECVEKTSGTVDKFIGDAVMAHWGTASTAGTPEKDAVNCVICALMMRVVLLRLNNNRPAGDPSNPPIRIGCGINSGIVTAGQIGSDRRMEYTVIGDPVNLASRVESLTKTLGTDILITEDTLRLIGDRFITEEMPAVTVKGKQDPVRLFAVINHKDTKGPRTLTGLRTLLGIQMPDARQADAKEKNHKTGSGV